RLRDRTPVASPAERLADACEVLRDDPGRAELPDRVSLFGLTRFPASYLDVLHALGHRREVHLFLLHPSDALWARVADRLAPDGPVPRRRRDDPGAGLPRHPLLGAWGHDAREMQVVLARAGTGGAGVVDRPVVTDASTGIAGRATDRPVS